MEIVDQASLQQVNAVYRMGLDTEAACLLLVQTAGDDAERSITAIAALCSAHGATEVRHVTDPAEGDMFVEVRRAGLAGVRADRQGTVPEDVAVPASGWPSCSPASSRSASATGSRCPPSATPATATCTRCWCSTAATPTRSLGREPRSATSSRCHWRSAGPSLPNAVWAPSGHAPSTCRSRSTRGRLAVQHRVKHALDPLGLLNPGKAI